MNIVRLAAIDLQQPLGQLRAVPVQLRPGEPEALVLIYGADQDIDPFMGMFFFPKDTLKMALWVPGEGIRWKRELHRGVIPGVWFSPLIPFDLDQDGTEELWMVLNQDAEHPLDIKKYRLEKIDPLTGSTIAVLPWKGLDFDDYTASQRYRHYLAGGYADGRPVLACLQGTYSTLQVQGLGPDGTHLWEIVVPKDAPGARGSHSCPVVDYDQDGNDELFHGERCLRFKDGTALFVGDEHVWNGHSDVVAPFWNEAQSSWNLFTARESPYVSVAPPRVVTFGANGRRIWSDLEEGHMDMGWVGRVGAQGEQVAYALRLGGKRAGRNGAERTACEEFFWDPATGARVQMPCPAFELIPADLDGDGRHELVPGTGVQAGCQIYDGSGRILGELDPGMRLAHASKVLDRVGEQVVVYRPDGVVAIHGIDRPASADADVARWRFTHPFYRRNRKLTAVGGNFANLGGL
jgi:hypothetical protein